MIKLHSLSYKNFLAAGNHPIELTLDASPATLVVGENGVGKSSGADAIAFCWFNRGLRNVNKAQLLNSINNGGCLVTLVFSKGPTQYKVVRGIKPNVFDIFKNDTLIPKPADNKDYQNLLETEILGFSFKTFTQIIELGSGSYTPFMALPAAQRREFIEDLLDIKVFGAMNAAIKEDIRATDHALETTETKISMLKQQVSMAKAFNQERETKRLEALADVEQQIRSEIAFVTEAINEQRRLHEKLSIYQEPQQDLQQARQKLQQIQFKCQTLRNSIKDTEKERRFYEQNDTCSTCSQPITAAFKDARYATYDEQIRKWRMTLEKGDQLIEQHQAEIATLEKTVKAAQDIKIELARVESDLSVHTAHAKRLKGDYERLSEPTPPPPESDVESLEHDLKVLEGEYARLTVEHTIQKAASMVMKDGGIKTRVIKHYLPLINQSVNTYLNEMDFAVQFTLDEEFGEHILSRYRDEFSYESFSQGQQMRIDLALLLTWRKIASLKNSVRTNLLILDEIFDRSLDSAGMESALKILETLEKEGTHVFVMSHRGDQLADRFPNILKFELVKGFSQVSEVG